MKYKNETLFKMYVEWCDAYKVKMEYNKISFGMRITVLMKKQLNTNGYEFKKYFVNLNGYEFGEKEEVEEDE